MADMNGEMLEELRTISREDAKTLPVKVFMRLLAAGVVGLHDKVGEMSAAIDTLDKKIEMQADDGRKRSTTIDEIQKQITELRNTCFENGLARNPLIILGSYIKKNPKTTGTIVLAIITVILVASNLWFVDSFRHDVMVMLHVPEPVMRWLFVVTPVP